MKRPDVDGVQRQVVPVFPLPNVFLFPGSLMPLHIFEPRYKQMIEDLLDRPGRLVMGTILDGLEREDGEPQLFECGGLGEIVRHERLPEGRFLIWLLGQARVRIEEVPSDRLYRRVAIEELEDVPPPFDAEAELREKVQRAVLARAPEFVNLPEEVPLGHLTDLLLQRLQLPQSTMRTLYAEMDLTARACGALLEHDRREIPPPRA